MIINHVIYHLIVNFISMFESQDQSHPMGIIRDNFSNNFDYFDRISVILSIHHRKVPGSREVPQ